MVFTTLSLPHTVVISGQVILPGKFAYVNELELSLLRPDYTTLCVFMTFSEYLSALSELAFGKQLPDAYYIHREGLGDVRGKLKRLTKSSISTLNISDDYNLIKFHKAQFRITFLSYPDFYTQAHPVLCKSILVDVVTGKTKETSFDKRANPPILHRKETFLPQEHPQLEVFKEFTKQEEKVGLFDNPRGIGFRQNWEKLLASKGLKIEGHELLKCNAQQENQSSGRATIDRHKTAIVRYDLSRPVKALIESDLFDKSRAFFDYGCGHGADIKGLLSLGYNASGWDPAHNPEQPKKKADFVNLGYVINVIEDPIERVETLIEAWEHSTKLLVVSALVRGKEAYANARPYKDGLITRNNTFQKYFDQTELQAFIESALHRDAIPVELGIYFVFKDDSDQQDYLSNRSRRRVNWTELTAKLGFERPKGRERVARLSLYERHSELLDDFWQRLLLLGRPPHRDEYSRFDDIRRVCKSSAQAVRLFVDKFGESALQEAKERRKEDLMVYLANEEFKKRRTPFSHLSPSLRRDLKAFYGDYHLACDQARELLFAAGDDGELELAAEVLSFGVLDNDEGHYTFHRSMLSKLPPILRIYVGCGAMLYGDPEQADLIKIHLRSGKLTFHLYSDFEGENLPELHTRVKIDLRRCYVQVFEHQEGRQQLLYFKEKFLDANDDCYPKADAFSAKLRKLGLDEKNMGRFGPTKEQLLEALDQMGYTYGLNKRHK